MNINTAILAVVTTVCSAGAAWSTGYQLFVRRRWPKVSAEIVRYRISRSDGDRGQAFFHPAYRFTTLDGETKIGLSSWGWRRRPWPRGAKVFVRYNPDNPRRTEIQCFANEWGIASTLVALALGFWAVIYWLPLNFF